MSICIYKIFCDARFEAGSSYSFGDMTSQNFPQKMGTSHQFRLLFGERVYKSEFYVKNRSSLPKIDLKSCQFQEFSSRGNFSIFKIFGTSRWEKNLIDQFCSNLVRMCLKGKN